MLDVRPPARLKEGGNEFEVLMAGWCAMTCSAIPFPELAAAYDSQPRFPKVRGSNRESIKDDGRD